MQTYTTNTPGTDIKLYASKKRSYGVLGCSDLLHIKERVPVPHPPQDKT